MDFLTFWFENSWCENTVPSVSSHIIASTVVVTVQTHLIRLNFVIQSPIFEAIPFFFTFQRSIDCGCMFETFLDQEHTSCKKPQEK